MVTLYLDRGATLLAASVPLEGTSSGGYDRAEPQDPMIEQFQDYGHNHWPSNGANFALTGVRGFRTFGSRSVPDKRFDTSVSTIF